MLFTRLLPIVLALLGQGSLLTAPVLACPCKTRARAQVVANDGARPCCCAPAVDLASQAGSCCAAASPSSPAASPCCSDAGNKCLCLHNPGHETAAPAVAVDTRLATGDLTGMATPAALFQPESSSIGEILRDDYDPHPGRRLHSLLCVWLN